jgi:hypothetical protein
MRCFFRGRHKEIVRRKQKVAMLVGTMQKCIFSRKRRQVSFAIVEQRTNALFVTWTGIYTREVRQTDGDRTKATEPYAKSAEPSRPSRKTTNRSIPPSACRCPACAPTAPASSTNPFPRGVRSAGIESPPLPPSTRPGNDASPPTVPTTSPLRRAFPTSRRR